MAAIEFHVGRAQDAAEPLLHRAVQVTNLVDEENTPSAISSSPGPSAEPKRRTLI